MSTLIYPIQDLASAQAFLSNYPAEVILTNQPGSTKYYGMLVLDYMFKTLRAEFPQVIKVIVNTGDDKAARYTALKLKYEIYR